MNFQCDISDLVLQVNIDKPLKEWVAILCKEYSYPVVKKAIDDYYKNAMANAGHVDGFSD